MDIVMPSLGADMDEGTLSQWLVKVGDTVAAGDIIAVIETNKGAIDMEAYNSGVISELCLEPEVTVPAGTVMAKLTSELDHDNKQIIDSNGEVETDVETDVKSAVDRVLVSPAARLFAEREHIDLSSITGSGPHGAVVLRDLYLAEPRRPAQAELVKQDKEILPPNSDNKMQRTIALIMEKSKREIPHYYLTAEIDLSITKTFLDKANAEREPEQRILLLALLLRAIATVLSKHPLLNGYYQNNEFEAQKNIHIGNAITLRGGGLVVPAIHNVDQLSLDKTMAALRDVIDRSRSGHLRSSELSDATITVSNIGDRGADAVFAVIYPPQVAIIGLGKPQQKARVIDGEVKACFAITVTLSADHRVSDGFAGAQFLNALDNQLQHPEIL